jgi:CubicO group peptidase (beta-lactamase class C family)
VVRRVSGHSIGSCLRTEVAARLNADIYFGVPQSEEARVAEIQPESPPSAGTTSLWTELLKDPTSMGARAFFNPPRPPQGMNTRAWRAAEIPASNAHASARGLARLYAGLARGGSLDGVSILDAEVIEQAVVEQSIGPDAVIRMQSRFGLGFWLPTPAAPYGSRRRAFGHPGRGGSVGFADPESRVGFGYVPNQYRGTSLDEQDPRATALIDAVYESLGSARLQRA